MKIITLAEKNFKQEDERKADEKMVENGGLSGKNHE